MRRHEITDDAWNRIMDLLPGKAGDPGVTAKDNRLFVNAILWIAKTGAPWRDLPERFGNWNSVWRRFDRWASKGVWERIFQELQDPDLEWLLLDSTVIRAHQHAAGAKKGLPTTDPNKRHWAAPEVVSPPRSTYRSVVWASLWKSD
jgi:transposase